MTLIGSAIFFLISFFLFSFLTWSYPLLSPDEPRYAETAREMLASGNFIIPYLDGVPRLVKPVLFYWSQAFCFKVFGLNEFAARLPSVLAASGVVSMSFLFASLNGLGLITAVITMTSFVIFIAAKLAITDMLLNFFITAALVFFYIAFDHNCFKKKGEAFSDPSFSIWMTLSMVMMGLGFLTKGPIAFLIPISIIFIFVLLKRDLESLLTTFYKEISLGLFLALLINLPWYVLIHIATNGKFTSQFFFSDNINRFLEVHTAHSAPFWFYVPVIFAGLFPWSFFLIQSIFAQDFSSSLNLKSEKARQEQAFFFCSVWAVVVFVFFTISKTKLPTYILPIFVPFCFFIARWWQQRFAITRSQNSKNMTLFWGLISFAITVIVAFLVYLFKFKEALTVIEPNSFLLAIILICSFYLAGTAIALTSVFTDAKISFIFFTGANLISLILFNAMILKPFVEYRDGGSKAFVKSLPSEAVLKTMLCHPSRFSFYSKRVVSKIKPKEVKEYFASSNSQDLYLVLSTKHFPKLEKRIIKDDLRFVGIENNKIYNYIKKAQN